MTASSETLVSTVFWKKSHAQNTENTVNTNEFKYNIFHGKQVKQTKTLIFIPCLGNGFSKNMLCLGNFWLPKLFQKHGNFWSSRRIRSVILTIFTMFSASALSFMQKNVPAPCPKPTPPKGHFWRYLRCFMCIDHSSKKGCFFLVASGKRGGAARVPM